jgi:hypothetical protein
MNKMWKVIGSNKMNPWFVLCYVVADDIWEAEKLAILKYGLLGFRTVQLAPKRKI